MSVTTVLEEATALTPDDRERLSAMMAAVYPPKPEGYPETARDWAPQQWRVLVIADQELVAHVGVVVREAFVDGRPVLTGGVGGVATHPAHRRKGYAALGIGRALDFLLERDVQFALLVCRPELIGYYEGLGWRHFGGILEVTQFGEPETFTFNEVMVGDLRSAAPESGTIDLRGPPW